MRRFDTPQWLTRSGAVEYLRNRVDARVDTRGDYRSPAYLAIRRQGVFLITRQELSRRQREFAKDRRRRSVVVIALALAVALISFGVSIYLRTLDSPEWLATTISFMGIAAVPFVFWWGDTQVRKLQQEQQVLCPHCGEALIDLTGKLALTIGRCGSCGETILTDNLTEN